MKGDIYMMNRKNIEDIIRSIRVHSDEASGCGGCAYYKYFPEATCFLHMIADAADATEAAEKRIEELEADKNTLIKVVKDKSEFHCTKDAMRIAELEAQLQKIKSRIYDLEDMAKREYDDDPDNEYLEGYFDGLHQAAKLISTMPTTDREQERERC